MATRALTTTGVRLAGLGSFALLALGCSGAVESVMGYGNELKTCEVEFGKRFTCKWTPRDSAPHQLWIRYRIQHDRYRDRWAINGPIEARPKVLADGERLQGTLHLTRRAGPFDDHGQRVSLYENDYDTYASGTVHLMVLPGGTGEQQIRGKLELDAPRGVTGEATLIVTD